MRKPGLCVLVAIVLLAAAPGCRLSAGAAAVGAALGVGLAESEAHEMERADPPCDRHSVAPPIWRCR